MTARKSIGLALSATLAAAVLITGTAIAAKGKASPITIDRMGSFATGGAVLGEPGKNSLSCDQGYVEFKVPARARKTNLWLWHSSSTHVWEARWDGGEGYESLMLRRGYPVYKWDGPRVGRGTMSCEPTSYTPAMGQDERNHVAWRFGPEVGKWFEGIQFPTGDAGAYEQAMRARYVEWDVARNAHLEGETAATALDRIGPTVILTNSAGDWRAMLAAMASKTDNVRGLVAYEPAAFVFPEGEGPSGPETGFGPTHVPLEQFRKLTRFPIQIVWGDYTGQTYWKSNVEVSRQFAALVNKYGGKAEVLMLPDAGLKGNSHIPFADLNNAQVAAQLDLFMRKNGLDKR